VTAGLLVDFGWKGAIVLLAAWGCARLLRHSPAATRHLLWATALVALLTLPLLAIVGPVWRLEILPTASPEVSLSPGLKSRPTSGSWSTSGHRPAIKDQRAAGGQGAVLVGRNFSSAAIDASKYPGHRTPETARFFASKWSNVALIVWAAGALVGLLRLVVGLAWAALIRRRAAVLLDADWLALVAEGATLLGISRAVPVRISDGVGVPVTCGIVRPTLLLPAAAHSWPEARRRAVVLHELAHVARRDCLVQALGHASRSLHWFNPLAFLALRRLRREQELACDDAVLGAGMSAVEYARHLCDVACAMRSMRSPEWATLAMAAPSNLEVRVTSVLDDRMRRQASRRAYRAAAALIVAGALPFSALRLSAVTTPVVPGVSRVISHAARMPEMPELVSTSAVPPDTDRRTAEDSIDAALPAPNGVPDVPLDEVAAMPDFSGTWILDEARSGSPSARQVDASRLPQWGDTVVIRHGDMWLRIDSRRGDEKATATYPLDDREYRFVEERSAVGGGISLRGSDVKTVWDGAKLVTLTRPFSLWVPAEQDLPDAPNTSAMEFLSVRSLSADGQEMIVERVSRHDWGWGFDGRQPSAAYARITDVYRRAP
jgi:beta-lactamase regulating signal transducer with metallopeptidase domain